MRTILALLALTVAATATPQDLTKAETGKVAVGQCYSACLADAHDASGPLQLAVDDAYVYLAEIDAGFTSNIEEEALAAKVGRICARAQHQYRLMEGCHYGCADLESVYGRQNTSIKTRYIWLLRAVRKPLEDAGLWEGYSKSPAVNTAEFGTACEALWENVDFLYEPVFSPQ